jgi:hypothetical protein
MVNVKACEEKEEGNEKREIKHSFTNSGAI